MPSAHVTFGPDDWRAIVAQLSRVHQQLLAKAQALEATLGQPDYVWTIGDDVCGYLAPVGSPALREPERSRLIAELRDDLETLRLLTARLAELQTMIQLGS